MNFLDKLVLPQSAEHIQLLHYLLMLILFLFIPFIGVVLGSTIISLYYKIKGLRESNELYIRFSKDIIETLTINKSIGIILGIIPIITAMLIYTQLLQGTNANISLYMVFSLFFVSIGLILIYTYRYSMTFMEIYDSVKDYKHEDKEVAEKISRYRKANYSLSGKSVKWGILFLFIGIWLFITCTTIVLYPEMWGRYNIFYLMFFWEVLAKFGAFLSGAIALTGSAVFFAFFFWEGGKNLEENLYREFVRKAATRFTFAGALLLPLFMVIDLFGFPDTAISGSVFLFMTLALVLIFFAYHLVYSMVKYANVNYSGHVFFIILLTILFLIIKDQVVLKNSTEVQTAAMNVKYEKMMAELTGTNKAVKAISGEQIYKNICSSCHSFDHKVVGPPYKETLPKYEGHIDQLISFIRNPVKKNPNYPPMPNPGLTPTEADSIAHFIMATYKK